VPSSPLPVGFAFWHLISDAGQVIPENNPPTPGGRGSHLAWLGSQLNKGSLSPGFLLYPRSADRG